MTLPKNLGYKPHLKKMSNVALDIGKSLGPRKRPSKAVDTSKFGGVANSVRGYQPQAGANVNVNSIMSSIGQYESGGNYSALGPRTAKGNQAYGKYQVMDFNIPNWTKQALGKSLTPQQFLKDKAAQDKVAYYKMDRLLKQYGNADDVASVWFSGRPVSKAGNAKDVIGTSVPTYIKNIRAIMKKQKGGNVPVRQVTPKQGTQKPNYIIMTDKDGTKYRYSHLLQDYVKLSQPQNPYLNYQIRDMYSNK